MSRRMSGQGFVPKAENIEMVACSAKRKANQQINPIFKPIAALATFNLASSTACVVVR